MGCRQQHLGRQRTRGCAAPSPAGPREVRHQRLQACAARNRPSVRVANRWCSRSALPRAQRTPSRKAASSKGRRRRWCAPAGCGGRAGQTSPVIAVRSPGYAPVPHRDPLAVRAGQHHGAAGPAGQAQRAQHLRPRRASRRARPSAPKRRIGRLAAQAGHDRQRRAQGELVRPTWVRGHIGETQPGRERYDASRQPWRLPAMPAVETNARRQRPIASAARTRPAKPPARHPHGMPWSPRRSSSTCRCASSSAPRSAGAPVDGEQPGCLAAPPA